MTRRQPPLWTWPASLVLAGVVVALLVGWKNHAVARYMWRDLNLARIASSPTPHDDVVVVGSSKVLCGLLFDQEMDARLHEAGAAVSFIRVGQARATSEPLAYVFQALDHRPAPRMVLIEDDLLRYEPFFIRTEGEPVTPGWRKRTRSTLKSVFQGDRAFSPGDMGRNAPGAGEAPCHNRYVLAPDVYSRQLAKRRASTPAEREAYLAPLRRLKRAGAIVGVLETPRAPDAARVFPKRLQREGDAVLASVVATEGLIRVGPAPHLPQSDFLDAGHLTADGRDAYSRWFVQQVAPLLRPRP